MIKNYLLKNIFLPIGDWISRQEVMKQYWFFCKAQWWDPEKLIKYQNDKLRNTIILAYNETAFYRKIYDEHGVKIDQIKNAQDLRHLPIVSKEMLKKSYPEACSRKLPGPWKEYFTSGSSGQPFAVRVDNYTMSIARALMLLRANFSGWQIGDKYLQTGMTLKRGWLKYIKDKVLGVKYVSAFNLTDKILDHYLDIIETNKIDYVMGYASSLYCLAERAHATGFNRNLKGIVSWGDNLFDHYRKLIVSQFNCRVTDSYGCGEGIQVGAQCGEGEGNGHYHIFSPHVIVEFVENGHPVPPGNLGDILLTRLNPGIMPLIRYKIGDIGRGSVIEKCPCGRGLPIMKSIEGRDSDIIITPNGNRLIVHFFTGIFEYETTIDKFQIIQNKLEEITVRVVKSEGFNEAKWKKIKEEIWKKGDQDLKIELELVDDIPFERSNKRRFVISRLMAS